MLSYKHGYHAGNPADVLKHICLIQAYKSLKKHYNSISYIDTHAGSGNYSFTSDYMSKNKEYEEGIKKLSNYQSNNRSIKYYFKSYIFFFFTPKDLYILAQEMAAAPAPQITI